MFPEGVLPAALLAVLAGALLCNCLPHLTSALVGRAFPTPFASPPGRGMSTPLVNLLWGIANLFLGAFIAIRRLPSLSPMMGLAAIGLGFAGAGLYLTLHFGKVMQDRSSGAPNA